MGRIHRDGLRKACLIFQLRRPNRAEGRVLRCLLEKFQEIRGAGQRRGVQRPLMGQGAPNVGQTFPI
jgi:hypothetical protein